MGAGKFYNENGGFIETTYEDVTPQVIINGVAGHVIKQMGLEDLSRISLPSNSDTSDMYFRYGADGQSIVQGALYINRQKICDFDWGHEHTNKKGDGKVFPKGVVHVQFYQDSGGRNMARNPSKDARLMTDFEIQKFGPIILHFNPNVKFRP